VANRAKGNDLVYIEPSSVKKLQNLGAEFKRAGANGKELRKELNAAIKKATGPLERDIKSNARGLTFTGSGSGGRARRTAGVTKTGRTRKGKGLRQSLEQGIKTEVSYRQGAGAGVRIRLKSSDAEVNRLGAALNRRGKIRHPLVGNTDHWFDTVASNGKGWFWKPVDKHRPAVVRDVKAAVDAMLQKLARRVG